MRDLFEQMAIRAHINQHALQEQADSARDRFFRALNMEQRTGEETV